MWAVRGRGMVHLGDAVRDKNISYLVDHRNRSILTLLTALMQYSQRTCQLQRPQLLSEGLHKERQSTGGRSGWRSTR